MLITTRGIWTGKGRRVPRARRTTAPGGSPGIPPDDGKTPGGELTPASAHLWQGTRPLRQSMISRTPGHMLHQISDGFKVGVTIEEDDHLTGLHQSTDQMRAEKAYPPDHNRHRSSPFSEQVWERPTYHRLKLL